MNETKIEDVSIPDPFPPLTTADRCDRCGAQAYFRYAFEAGDLLFCKHHQKKHKSLLDSTPVVSLFSAQDRD
jgi:hypothetical protein